MLVTTIAPLIPYSNMKSLNPCDGSDILDMLQNCLVIVISFITHNYAIFVVHLYTYNTIVRLRGSSMTVLADILLRDFFSHGLPQWRHTQVGDGWW